MCKRLFCVTKVPKKSGNVVFAIHYMVKGRLTSCTLLTRQRTSSFKSGHAMWVAKFIKEDWPIVLQ